MDMGAGLRMAISKCDWLGCLVRLCAVFCLVLLMQGGARAASAEFGFDHARTGFPLLGAHALEDCSSCHTNGLFKGTRRYCSACHTPGSVVGASTKNS